MILLALNYEYHLHHPNDPRSYTRFQYTRNQSLGFGALVCFCISYIWLIAAATKWRRRSGAIPSGHHYW